MIGHAFEALYRGYVLRFRPQPTPDGRYLAYVIIGHEIDGLRAQVSMTPDIDAFDDRHAAASAGLRAAQHWVDSVLARLPAKRHNL